MELTVNHFLFSGTDCYKNKLCFSRDVGLILMGVVLRKLGHSVVGALDAISHKKTAGLNRPFKSILIALAWLFPYRQRLV